MKVNYTTSNGKVAAEFESDSQRDLFLQISRFQEVFDEGFCGKCEGANLKYVVRSVEENSYYEIRCQDCGAKLEFGSMKQGGGLFPKRKDKEGNWLPDRGWVKWNSKTQKNE
jgi:hypothetical protein|tara:strand:- start:173 stop:508 length:336 start_codon:yes stop_codon:yes gene_type:complete